MKSLFKTGVLMMTKSVMKKTTEDKQYNNFVTNSIGRHLSGDWGDVSENDKQSNNDSVLNGNDMICSKYIYAPDTSLNIFIITDADRKHTTVLFPSEY
jgi:hypothetical protein